MDTQQAAVPALPEPARTRAVSRWFGAALLAAVPLVSLGLLAPVPAAVLALRFRRGEDLLVGLVQSVIWALWLLSLGTWNGYSGQPVAGTALLLLNTAGPTAHAVVGWTRHRP